VLDTHIGFLLRVFHATLFDSTLSHAVLALHANALRSNGTLLPLPALYLFGPPLNGLGMGNASSGWNLNLVSCTTNLAPPLPPPIWLVPRERAGEPPFVRVYADASMGCNAPELDPRDWPPAVGIEVVDLAALGGAGGGGGGAWDARCVGGGGGGGGGLGAVNDGLDGGAE
jgi:hypothetical protein